MVIKGSELPCENGRRPYPLPESGVPLEHFVMRVTTPDNPFTPHKHEQAELWYVARGEGLLYLDGTEQAVREGDLIVLTSGVEHGLRTETEVTWICLA